MRNEHWFESMGQSKKDVTPVLAHWSYVFLALTVEIMDWHLDRRHVFFHSNDDLVHQWVAVSIEFT